MKKLILIGIVASILLIPITSAQLSAYYGDIFWDNIDDFWYWLGVLLERGNWTMQNLAVDGLNLSGDYRTSWPTGISNGIIYAQLSDLNDQVFAQANTEQAINLSNEDEIIGLAHSIGPNNSEIGIVTAGVYSIIAQPQITAGPGQSGSFHMWLEKYNGTDWIDIPNSNVELTLASQDEDVIPLIATISLNDTEKIRIMGSVSNTGIFLDSIAPIGEPVIPSIIFSMFIIGLV